MKILKQLPLLFSAMFAVASCASDEYLATNENKVGKENAIEFSSNLQTRGGETLTALNSFTSTITTADGYAADGSITGAPQIIADGAVFTWDNSASVFKSNPVLYWPQEGSLNFYAISQPGTPGWRTGLYPFYYDYTDWDGTHDLVAAVALAGEKQRPYPMTFHHLTSQISVSCEASAADKAENLMYRIKRLDCRHRPRRRVLERPPLIT